MGFLGFLDDIIAFVGMIVSICLELFFPETLDKAWFKLCAVVNAMVAGYMWYKKYAIRDIMTKVGWISGFFLLLTSYISLSSQSMQMIPQHLSQ